MFLIFVFTDTATTEFSTYSHTLSLHDALPISQRERGGREPFLQPVPPYPGTDPLELPRHALEIIDRRSHPLPPFEALRSEEHTSELQSLMRISYAVFCLKKKKPHS